MSLLLNTCIQHSLLCKKKFIAATKKEFWDWGPWDLRQSDQPNHGLITSNHSLNLSRAGLSTQTWRSQAIFIFNELSSWTRDQLPGIDTLGWIIENREEIWERWQDQDQHCVNGPYTLDRVNFNFLTHILEYKGFKGFKGSLRQVNNCSLHTNQCIAYQIRRSPRFHKGGQLALLQCPPRALREIKRRILDYIP